MDCADDKVVMHCMPVQGEILEAWEPSRSRVCQVAQEASRHKTTETVLLFRSDDHATNLNLHYQ
jgi:hypothetical protein